jgi:hypothetical protein
MYVYGFEDVRLKKLRNCAEFIATEQVRTRNAIKLIVLKGLWHRVCVCVCVFARVHAWSRYSKKMTRSEVVADNNVAYYHAYKYSSLPDLQRKYYLQGDQKVSVHLMIIQNMQKYFRQFQSLTMVT